MFAVIFETRPNPGEMQQYLGLAAALQPGLLKMDGFLESERFRRNDRQDALLTLSFWNDEASLMLWRAQELHHPSQERGKNGMLSDYRLRVGEVHSMRDIGSVQVLLPTPYDVQRDAAATRWLSISIDAPPQDIDSLRAWRGDLLDSAQFSSLLEPSRQLLLLYWRDAVRGDQWLQARQIRGATRHFGVQVTRMCSMQNRLPAPLLHPAAVARAHSPLRC